MSAVDGVPAECLGPNEHIQILRKRAFIVSWNYSLGSSVGSCNACLVRNDGTIPGWSELKRIQKETAEEFKLQGATMVLMAVSEIAPPEEG